jgi:hypothetical protein
MMRIIRVRNASILAKLNDHDIDFEIRTSKNSAQGFALLVDGVRLLDIDSTPSGTLKDSQRYKTEPVLFSLKDVKSNGCLSAIHVDSKGKIKIQ